MPREGPMKICPIAIAVGCPRCVFFKVCPVKGVIGGYKPGDEKAAAAAPTANPSKK